MTGRALALGAALPAQAETAAELLARGTEARLSQRPMEARAALEAAYAVAPDNADVLVQLGFARLALNDLENARKVFEAALRLAPDYADAALGLAQIALRRGDLDAARARADRLVAAEPQRTDFRLFEARLALREGDPRRAAQGFAAAGDGAEALLGLGDARRELGEETAARAAYRLALAADPAARERLAAPPPRRTRLDFGSAISRLDGGRGEWTDTALALSRSFHPRTTARIRLRRATRPGLEEFQIEARLDRRLRPDLGVYALVAATPGAEFLARRSLGIGATLDLAPERAAPVALTAGLDLRRDWFEDADVTTLAPRLRVALAGDRFGLGARWIHTNDGGGTTADGWVATFDGRAGARLLWRLGYADAPELDDGLLFATRTISAGLSFEATADLTLRADLVHERRDAFERTTLGLGAALRF